MRAKLVPPKSSPPAINPVLGWVVFVIGAVFYSYEFLLRIMPSVMTTDLMQAHHVTTAGLGYLISIYYVVYTAMQLPVGLLIDTYGPRRLLLMASAVCAIGSFFFASTNSLFLAGLGRFLIGLGSAFGFVGVLRLASLWLPINRFALATGLITTLGMIGGVLGDVGLNHLVIRSGWHNAVVFSAWIGIALMLPLYFIPEGSVTSFKQSQRSLQWAQLWQQTLLILRMPVIWLNALAGSLLYIPLSVFGELWGVSYLQNAQQLNPVDAALAISWLMWGWAVGAPLVGWLADKTGSRYRVVLTCSALSFVFILYVLHTQFHGNTSLFAAMFLLGLLCSGQILMMVIARDHCPPTLLATGMATTNMIIMGGSILFQPLIGILMRTHSAALIADKTSTSVSSAYTHAMYIVPAAILAGMIVLVLQRFLEQRTLSYDKNASNNPLESE
ncbi:MAG: MFS transporter [Gammaproteobacteria bacterium]|nr:MFS transporter [Gammaproteobacteria bacterium]